MNDTLADSPGPIERAGMAYRDRGLTQGVQATNRLGDIHYRASQMAAATDRFRNRLEAMIDRLEGSTPRNVREMDKGIDPPGSMDQVACEISKIEENAQVIDALIDQIENFV